MASAPRVHWRRERWETPDGDFIDVDFAGDDAARRTVLLFHGLEGSSASHYARSIAFAAASLGWRIALPHFRGCSGEPNRLPRAYHSGDSSEADWIIRRLALANVELHAAGVSLGGNVLLRWLGEQGAGAARLVRRAAAISAPFDLAAAGDVLDRGVNRRIYTRMFLATMRRKAIAKLEAHPGLYDAARVRAARTLREFDDVVTAPLHGFRDADDYWRRASSLPLFPDIRVPTLVLNARNDPFFPRPALRGVTPSPSVLLDFPEAGGHVGFPQSPASGTHAWLPRRIFHFLSGNDR